MDAQVDAGALSGLEYLVVELLADLGDHLLDAGGMDAPVDDELVQREPGHLPADGVEGREQDGVGGVVHDYLDSGGRLEGPNVPSLASDDASLDLVVLDGEGGHGILDGRFGGGALYGVDDNALGLACGVQPGFVHGVVDVGLGFGVGLGLEIVDQHLLGLL